MQKLHQKKQMLDNLIDIMQSKDVHEMMVLERKTNNFLYSDKLEIVQPLYDQQIERITKIKETLKNSMWHPDYSRIQLEREQNKLELHSPLKILDK